MLPNKFSSLACQLMVKFDFQLEAVSIKLKHVCSIVILLAIFYKIHITSSKFQTVITTFQYCLEFRYLQNNQRGMQIISHYVEIPRLFILPKFIYSLILKYSQQLKLFSTLTKLKSSQLSVFIYPPTSKQDTKYVVQEWYMILLGKLSKLVVLCRQYIQAYEVSMCCKYMNLLTTVLQNMKYK